MAFNKMRIVILAIAAVSAVVGLALGVSEVEAELRLLVVLGVGLGAGLVTYWYYWKKRQTGEVDERHNKIQGRASKWTSRFFFLAVSLLGVVLVVTDVTLPVGLILIGFVFAGIIVDELATEAYRRRM